MASETPAEVLGRFIRAERTRIVRRWAKRLRTEVFEVEIRSRDLIEPLPGLVAELARLLIDRGEDAIRLWPEVMRAHGAVRFDQRFDADDLARELKLLHEVLIEIYARSFKGIEPSIATLLAELLHEATAAVQASFTRLLRTEEVRFRDAALMESVLHHVEVGILVVEPDGVLSYATPPTARLIGVPVRALVGAGAQQLLGPVLGQLNARHPDGQPFRAADMPFWEALRRQEPVRAVPMLIDRHDGQEVLLEMTAVPLFEEGPNPLMIGVIQTFTDRTEVARASRELSTAHAEVRELESRLLQRSRAQAVGQLASGAAHALNNFLNVLRLRLTLIRREFKPDHLDALDRTVQRIGDLVARLQDLSAGRLQEELCESRLEPLVRHAADSVSSAMDRPDAQVNLELDVPTEVKALLDPALFQELIQNLLLASRERMPGGGNIRVVGNRDEGWFELMLEDDGQPWGEDALGSLFDPLKGRSGTPELALLLGVARAQIQRWGGELRAYDLEDRTGARFVVRLPELATEEEQQAAPLRAPPTHRVRKVLVVDDEPDNARMLAEVLGEEGYEVQVAHSADEALARFEQQPFDAALLDVMMPDVSGWELARMLRKRHQDVLLAMVTGADVRGQNRSTLALVDAIFRKPLDVDALDEFLSQVWGERDDVHEEPPLLPADRHP